MYILRRMATVSSLCHYPGTRVFPPEIRTLTPCSKGQAVGTQRCCLVAGDAGSHIGAAQASFHQGNWSLHRVSRALEGGLAMGDRPEEQGFRTWRVRGQSDSPSLARLAQKDSDLNPCKIF